ncbi:hypothetical protein ABPG73_017034 [Tetrahymena malaccensis]
MDKTILKTLKCQKHQKKDLQFIQVNDVLSQQSQKKELFYCSSCFNHDLEFKSINYLMIDQILQEAENSIIPKWPPVKNYQIIQDLIDITTNESELNYEKQITNFFDELKEQILAKIDIIQKNMINEILKYPIENHQIIQKYQEISNILQFKQLLSNEQANNLQNHSSICRQFIQQMESSKDKNTELLQSLLNKSNQFKNSFDLEYPNIIKQQLFTLIDQISFFNQDLSEIRQNQSSLNIQQSNINYQSTNKITADLIIKLVSNKSNFCDDQFIDKLNRTLQRLEPLLQQQKFHNVFKENRQPIEFSKMNEEKLILIEEYVKHSIKLKSDKQYEIQTKNQFEIKQINEILNNKINFINQEFNQKFEKIQLEIQPFLKQINFQNCFYDKNKFDLFNNLEDQRINDLIKTAQKGLFYFNQNISATGFNNGQENIIIRKNQDGKYIIQKQNHSWNYCISSLDLKKDLKYIFRIKIENIDEGDEFLVGLMRNSISKDKGGWNDYLSCELKNESQYLIRSDENYGIVNLLKGQGEFKIRKENTIELRVSIKDKLLQVTDYPNYLYKLGLEDKYISQLEQNDDLRFYFGFKSSSIQICFKEAKVVEKFKDQYIQNQQFINNQ